MRNDRDIQAPWVGQSDWDYLGWETEEEAEQRELAYDEYIDRLIDERKEEEWFREKENKNVE